MSRRPTHRRRRAGRRPPHRYSGGTGPPRPAGFTGLGFRQAWSWILPGLEGPEKKRYFNELSVGIIVSAGLCGLLLGLAWFGPIGATTPRTTSSGRSGAMARRSSSIARAPARHAASRRWPRRPTAIRASRSWCRARWERAASCWSARAALRRCTAPATGRAGPCRRGDAARGHEQEFKDFLGALSSGDAAGPAPRRRRHEPDIVEKKLAELKQESHPRLQGHRPHRPDAGSSSGSPAPWPN